MFFRIIHHFLSCAEGFTSREIWTSDLGSDFFLGFQPSQKTALNESFAVYFANGSLFYTHTPFHLKVFSGWNRCLRSDEQRFPLTSPHLWLMSTHLYENSLHKRCACCHKHPVKEPLSRSETSSRTHTSSQTRGKLISLTDRRLAARRAEGAGKVITRDRRTCVGFTSSSPRSNLHLSQLPSHRRRWRGLIGRLRCFSYRFHVGSVCSPPSPERRGALSPLEVLLCAASAEDPTFSVRFQSQKKQETSADEVTVEKRQLFWMKTTWTLKFQQQNNCSNFIILVLSFS